jgi:hypothetical protein
MQTSRALRGVSCIPRTRPDAAAQNNAPSLCPGTSALLRTLETRLQPDQLRGRGTEIGEQWDEDGRELISEIALQTLSDARPTACLCIGAGWENIRICRELRSREVAAAAAGLPVGVLPSVVDEQVALIRLRDC